MSFQGLTESEVRRKLATDGENVIPSESAKSFGRQVINVLSEPMLILLVAAGAINFLLAEFLDAAMLMVTVVIVLGISIYQSRRAENALQALKELTAPSVRVIRDGIEKRVSSHELVVGDLLLLSEGDRICADARLKTATSFAVDESTVTGESVPVDKKPEDQLLSGTLVTRGHGRAIVEATGIQSQLGKIGKSLQEITLSRSRLQHDVDQLVRVIGVLGIITVIAVVTVYGSTRNNWLEGGLAGIAAAMALIPEEFPVILTLFLAIGAWRMSKSKVIARQPSAIEVLGSISVLCVDKTGTITENHMSVAEIQVSSTIFDLRSDVFDPGAIELLQIAALACPVHSYDPMDIAFLEANIDRPVIEVGESVVEYPVENSRLAFIHGWNFRNSILYAAKGAPETISQICKFSSEQHDDLITAVNLAADRGFRVLAVAKAYSDSSKQELTPIEQIKFDFLGLAFLQDPTREGVKASVYECRTAGIKTVMITGDHPNTAKSIAADIGLENIDSYLTGAAIDEMSDQALAQEISRYSIFARVRPEHKLRIVRALQASGNVVAMTGDGVNDAPALRAADIGIAMGGRGTDVAREAAALVITDDRFTSIVEGIKRGRVTYDNLQKAMSYVIAIHIPIFGLALLPIFSTNWPLILLPGLVAFHEVIIDPACSVVFEEEGADPRVMEEKPRSLTGKIFSRGEILLSIAQGLAVLISLTSLFLWANQTDRSEQEIRSLIFGALMISNIGLILTNRSRTLTILATFRERSNRTVKWILALAIILLLSLLNISHLRSLFDLGAIEMSDWALMFLFALVSLSWYEIYKFFAKSKLSRL